MNSTQTKTYLFLRVLVFMFIGFLPLMGAEAGITATEIQDGVDEFLGNDIVKWGFPALFTVLAVFFGFKAFKDGLEDIKFGWLALALVSAVLIVKWSTAISAIFKTA